LQINLFYSEGFKRHCPEPSHPESPLRSEAIFKFLLSGPLKERIKLRTPRKATFEELYLVHEKDYLLALEEACFQGRFSFGGADNQISFDTFEVARLAAGAALEAVNLAREGEKISFCPVRPPGHHALPGRALGFCFLNNCALAARYWLEYGGISRLVILDWDAHHGNGIQEIFYEDPRVLYISLHEDPRLSFPGTGFPEERGAGPGKGYNFNFPFPAGADDKKYLELFHKKIIPLLETFAPEGIIIACGFDAHRDDDFSLLNLTSQAFYEMSKLLGNFAGCRNIPLISLLEGGYDLESLVVCAERHLQGLVEGLKESAKRAP